METEHDTFTPATAPGMSEPSSTWGNVRPSGPLGGEVPQPSSHNWGFLCNSIPVFSGGPNTISAPDFFAVLEQLAQLNHWNDEHKISVAKLKMTGPAANFVWHDAQALKPLTFLDFKRLVITRFETQSAEERLTKFLSAYQRVDEDARQFATRLQTMGYATLAPNAEESRAPSDQSQRLLEDQLKVLFIRGLREPVRRHVLSRDPPTFAAAIDAAAREEMYENLQVGTCIKKIEDTRHVSPPPPQVDPLAPSTLSKLEGLIQTVAQGVQQLTVQTGQNSTSLGTLQQRVQTLEDTLTRQPSRPTRSDPPVDYTRPQVHCWNCGIFGHLSRNCRRGQPTGPRNRRYGDQDTRRDDRHDDRDPQHQGNRDTRQDSYRAEPNATRDTGNRQQYFNSNPDLEQTQPKNGY